VNGEAARRLARERDIEGSILHHLAMLLEDP